MGVIYSCDGCGRIGEGEVYNGDVHKPRNWFIRGDDDGVQISCSRACIDKISAKTGKTSVVLPI